MDSIAFDFIYFNFHKSPAHTYLNPWEDGYLASLVADPNNSESDYEYLIPAPVRGSVTEDTVCWRSMASSIEFNHSGSNLKYGKCRRAKEPLNFVPQPLVASCILSDCQDTVSTGEVSGEEQPSLSQMIDQVNKVVKDRLKHDKHFRIDDGTKIEKVLFSEVLDSAISQTYDRIKPFIERKDFAKLCMSEKEISVSFQAYIESCSEEEVKQICDWVFANMNQMIVHQYGNYIVQKLVKRSAMFQKSVATYCQTKFYDLASNEFSSRVMQTLVEMSKDFRTFCLKSFKSDLSNYAQSISAVFLLSVAIRCSASDSEYSFVKDALLRNTKKWLGNKYLKRIIVSYLQNCSSQGLDSIFKGLRIESTFLKFLDDKYSCYMLLMFIERHHDLTKAHLLKRLQTDLKGLLSTKFFRFFFSKILKCGEASLITEINKQLAKVSAKDNFEKQLSQDNLYFFAYMFANSCRDESTNALQSFIATFGVALGLITSDFEQQIHQ